MDLKDDTARLTMCNLSDTAPTGEIRWMPLVAAFLVPGGDRCCDASVELLMLWQTHRVNQHHVSVGEPMRITHSERNNSVFIVVVGLRPSLGHLHGFRVYLIFDGTGKTFMGCCLRRVRLRSADSVVIHKDRAVRRHPWIVAMVMPTEIMRRLE